MINGPNINMIGIREPEIYGKETYADLEKYIKEVAKTEKIEVEIYQSNHEGCLVDKIQEAYQKVDGIIINPAAYTHMSIAILDAVKAVNIPTVEVHLSNVSEREEFRQISYVRAACIKSIVGKGFAGYKEAIEYLVKMIL